MSLFSDEIPEKVCSVCGRSACARQTFVDSQPEWVGDDREHYDRAAAECVEAAKDLGERYATLWALAAKKVRADEYYMGERAAMVALAEFLRSTATRDA